MNEVFVISAALIGSYAAFMFVTIFFGKLFFPFHTKEQSDRMNTLSKPLPADRHSAIGRKVIAELNLRKNVTLHHPAFSKMKMS
jgi:hypothetical protein